MDSNYYRSTQMLHGTDHVPLTSEDSYFDMSLPYKHDRSRGFRLLAGIIYEDERPQLSNYRGVAGFEDLLLGTWHGDPVSRLDINEIVARLLGCLRIQA